MSEASWIQILSSFGFPTFVAVWLMVRSDRILSELTKALNELTAELKNRRE